MRDRPKIAFVIPLLSSGGAERATASVASAIDPERYEPVIVLQTGGPRTYEPADHVRVVEVGAPRTHSALLPLTRTLRDERPDLIYAVLPHLALICAAATTTMRHPRPKLAVGIQNNLGAELPQWSNGALLQRLTPWVYRRADALITVSAGLRDEAVDDFGADRDDVHVIPNSVAFDTIRAGAAQPEPHRWLDDPAITTLIAIGRLAPQKNYPVLLSAFAQLAPRHPQARLLILGEGELRSDIEARIDQLGLADRVELAGARPNPFGYLARADAFLSSSDFEGFPMVHLEALTCGVPVVATDCDFGPAEILGTDERWGVLAPTGSASGFAAAVERLLADPARQDQLRADGPGRAELFRLERVVPQFEALFDELLAARR